MCQEWVGGPLAGGSDALVTVEPPRDPERERGQAGAKNDTTDDPMMATMGYGRLGGGGFPVCE